MSDSLPESAGEAAAILRQPPARFADYSEVSDTAALPATAKVSVLVVTYRHESVLAECIASIAGQRLNFPFEIVVAEDSSPDGTRAVAIAMQRKYPDLVRVVFTSGNKGGTTNSIFGIAMCRGEFIAVCDGDDFWIDPDKLARQVTALEGMPQVDMSFTSGYRLYPDGRRVPDWNWGEEERVITTRELFSTFGWTAPPASLLLRSQVLRDLPELFESTAFGDFTIIVAGSVRGGAHYDPRKTICYRIGYPTGFTATVTSASRGERIRFLEGAIRQIDLTCRHYGFPARHVSHRINDLRLSLAKLHSDGGERGKALRLLAAIGPAFFAKIAWRRLSRGARLLPEALKKGRPAAGRPTESPQPGDKLADKQTRG